MPYTLTAALVPCVRRPIPVAPPDPAEVLPLSCRQSETFPPAPPESTRIPLRAPDSGAATVLFVIDVLIEPELLRMMTLRPTPSVALILLPDTVRSTLGT